MTPVLMRSIAQLLFGGVITATAVTAVVLAYDAHRAGLRRVRGGRR